MNLKSSGSPAFRVARPWPRRGPPRRGPVLSGPQSRVWPLALATTSIRALRLPPGPPGPGIGDLEGRGGRPGPGPESPGGGASSHGFPRRAGGGSALRVRPTRSCSNLKGPRRASGPRPGRPAGPRVGRRQATGTHRDSRLSASGPGATGFALESGCSPARRPGAEPRLAGTVRVTSSESTGLRADSDSGRVSLKRRLPGPFALTISVRL